MPQDCRHSQKQQKRTVTSAGKTEPWYSQTGTWLWSTWAVVWDSQEAFSVVSPRAIPLSLYSTTLQTSLDLTGCRFLGLWSLTMQTSSKFPSTLFLTCIHSWKTLLHRNWWDGVAVHGEKINGSWKQGASKLWTLVSKLPLTQNQQTFNLWDLSALQQRGLKNLLILERFHWNIPKIHQELTGILSLSDGFLHVHRNNRFWQKY